METPRDPFVRRALEQLPELVEQQEWSEHQARREAHGFEDEELTLHSVGHFILGPFLRRLLDRPEPSQEPLLKRSFALLEELLSSDDEGAVSTAKTALEYSVARHQRAEAAEPFLGPRSGALLESHRRALAPFKPAWERLRPCLEQVVAAARSRYPGIWAGVRYDTPHGGVTKFAAYATFMHDPAKQRYEDLEIVFWVGAAYSRPETRALGASSGDAVEFYIGRGGRRLGALTPSLLPSDGRSAERTQILVEYADAGTRLVEDRMAAILEALSEPFVPWFPASGRQRPGCSLTSPRLAATAEGREHWRRARERLEAGYRELLASLRAKGENIVMDPPDQSGPIGTPFSVSARFTYAGVPYEQVGLALEFVCAPAEQFWEAEEKAFPVFPDPGERDAVGFQVLEGAWPTVVGTLWPALLPEDEPSAEYASALMAYVERALAYAAGHVEMMRASLATQFHELRRE